MRILKFGGKSLETIEKTQKICKYLKKIYKNDKKLIVIVSAIGNTTNNLLESVKNFHPEIKAPRDLDSLLSTGETVSASMLSIILNSMKIPAKSFQAWQIKIRTHGAHQNSIITSIDKKAIEECLNKNTIAVIAGFQGINTNGDITTLGRGGSDTTASALGSIFNVNVELYSDFDGLFHCDPREVLTKKINTISLKQLDTITNHGSKIVSNQAVKIARENNLSIFLKSSTSPNNNGSVANNVDSEKILISTRNNLCEILINLPNESKIKFLSKNVLLWLKRFKIYNYTTTSENINLLINECDRSEILNILTKKLKIAII